MHVFGKNVTKEILNNPKSIKKAYIYENFNDDYILNELKKLNIPCKFLSRKDLDKIEEGNHQGIILDIEDYNYVSLDKILQNDLVVILDHLEDPHNFGAIIRTCECAGVDYIVIPNKRSVEITASVFKSSSGAVVHQKICKVANLHNTIEKLKKNGFWIIGTDANGEDYTSIDYTGKTALVIGSEGKGLQSLLRKSCDQIASIPLKGKINSLNASVAAGIMIYEIAKTK